MKPHIVPSTLLVACLVASPGAAQGTAATTRLEDAQSLVRAVFAAVQGRRDESTERPFSWSHDFFRGQAGTTYVPFTVTIDRASVSTSALAMHVVVMPHGDAAVVSSAPTATNTGEIQPPRAPEIAFENTYFIALDTARTSDAYRVSRAFSVSPGGYDVYVAVRARGGTGEPPRAGGAAAAVRLITQAIFVPDLWSGDLSTSTLVLAQAVEALAAPLPAEQQDANPYTLGTTRIVPAPDTDFAPSEELAVIFLVYHATLDTEGQPDLTVDYAFFQRRADGDAFFNQTPPQQFSPQTRPVGSVADPLVAGQAMSLQAFPPGAYRLAITVTDNSGSAALNRHVDFTVVDR